MTGRITDNNVRLFLKINFITYLKETIGLHYATVIVDYWMRDLSLNEDF